MAVISHSQLVAKKFVFGDHNEFPRWSHQHNKGDEETDMHSWGSGPCCRAKSHAAASVLNDAAGHLVLLHDPVVVLLYGVGQFGFENKGNTFVGDGSRTGTGASVRDVRAERHPTRQGISAADYLSLPLFHPPPSLCSPH